MDSGHLEEVTDGVWLATTPVSIVGMKLTSTMTVLQLANGELLLYSPTRLNKALQAAVERLGAVAHLYAPNLFHHMFMESWRNAFPSATVHAPRGLSKKRPELRIDRVHGAELDHALSASVREIVIAGCRLQEGVLFHEKSQTLVVADLVHNIGRPEQGWAVFYSRMMGFYDRVALSRAIRWTAFPDRAAARRSVDAVLALPFERIVVGHGTPVVEGARAALASAYGWLPAGLEHP